MNWTDFARWGARIADWGAHYHQGLRERPVRAGTRPGEVAAALPACPPETPEAMEAIFADFEQIVMPGMTHWQHPRFFAYFPANATPPSMLAEFLASTVAAQCMLWQTSPAATEMETVMMDWLRQSVGLPEGFKGVIQDSASSATLAAVLTMRERALDWAGNEQGLSGQPRLRVYCSGEVHTSIDRAIWISGIGAANLVRIPTQGPRRSMDLAALDAAIRADLAAGLRPCGVIACTGGTGTGACDDIAATLAVAKAHKLYTHVDAAWAGAAMICPEFRELWTGIEGADSIVFNPHKWLGVQFDCAAHFLSDPEPLVRTLAIRPEYLKTHGADGIVNYSEWSIPLGRRFRALKLWFVLRHYGLEGLRTRIRNHVRWSQALADRLRADPRFEIVTEPVLSLFTFRLKGADEAAQQAFINRINDDGRIYITQTRVQDGLVIRFQVGQFDATEADVATAFEVITALAGNG
ncbi:aromatic-L-amino-acid decarboxylase [Gemmobacter caeni]|uniref:Aromatic-L-amino-acid decarboxylase n=1 Tax=Gemmobacter caeni TaxID=589035 RepID=A0A2T6B0H1_9RHOB|nr:pyridoxal-dependent decarboxylase [Gemmobacter caeni]PTX49552.1 aromatic-L-amino-acid decarboxylase [Gemmobacter caeni]TWJ00401.1 aromatic-L-amino-acid decarboxylase [Gemmobacter caeni]